MSKWSFGVKISSFVVSMGMIAAAYAYTDGLMAWLFAWMTEMINSQVDQVLQGLLY